MRNTYKHEEVLELAHELSKYPFFVDVCRHRDGHADESEAEISYRHVYDVAVRAGVLVQASLKYDVYNQAITYCGLEKIVYFVAEELTC